MSAQGDDKQRTVFILYIPGGAMLGLIPALTLSRLESLTETSTQELFQVVEGVSTGSILTAGFGMPGMTAKKGAELYVQIGPKFFTDMPGRWAKMHTRNGINIAKTFYQLDPRQNDYLAIRNIEQLCKKMRERTTANCHALIRELEAEATERWLTRRNERTVLELAQVICEQDPKLQKYTDSVTELVATRTFTGRLGTVFKKAAVGVMDGVKNRWAKKEECLFDSETPEKTYKEMFGDRMISQSVCSTYISAYNIVNNSVITFSSLKDDLFSKDPNAPATVQNDIKLWDAVMASTANPLAYKPHITETNMLCSDKAIIHRPRSIKDVINKVDDDTKVVLVIAGTGKYLGQDLLENLDHAYEEDETLTEDQRYRRKLEILRDYYVEFGVAGNLLLGRELEELQGYTISDALEDFGEKIGKENIFDITPRLSPHTPQEKDSFPSRDTLDASRENITKIIKRGRQLSEEQDGKIRQLAQMMVDNLYHLGQMEQDKYARVCERIGLKAPDVKADVAKDTAGIENRIASNDNSTGLRRVWRGLVRKVSNGKWLEDSPPPPPRGPRGPGEGP